MKEGSSFFYLRKKKLCDPSTSSSLVAVLVVLLFVLFDLGSEVEAVEVLVLVDRRHVVA